MKERIDKFMKAVREKYPSNCIEWENLYRELSDLKAITTPKKAIF